MKKLYIIIGFITLGIESACHLGHHTTIINDTNGRYIKLEYSGNVYLTKDSTGIRGMARGGYFKYKTNDESIVAERMDDGRIAYEVNDGQQQFTLDETGKRLMTAAVKELLKRPHTEYRQ